MSRSSFPSNDNGPVRNDIRQYKTFVPQLERPPTPKWDTAPNPDIRQNPFSDKVGFSFFSRAFSLRGVESGREGRRGGEIERDWTSNRILVRVRICTWGWGGSGATKEARA